MNIRIKRIYENPEPEDGYRMLVDRLWSRGLTKEEACIDEWNKTIAPSTELRKWFHHQPQLFAEFASQYKAELKNQTAELERIRTIAKQQTLTLLYAAKNPEMSHTRVLKEVLEGI